MDDIRRSCVDCGIGNCNWEDASFPEFVCLPIWIRMCWQTQ